MRLALPPSIRLPSTSLLPRPALSSTLRPWSTPPSPAHRRPYPPLISTSRYLFSTMSDSAIISDASPSSSTPTVGYLRFINASEAAAIDEELMSPEGCGFLLPQLMELAGLACAQAVFKCYPPNKHPNLFVAAGPGNQGGDGLVAARHAKLWGYNVQVWYPKQGKADIFVSLRKQLEAMEIEFLDEDAFDDGLMSADVVLDSIFGFSFKGPPRPPFAAALQSFKDESRLEFIGRITRPPIVSVDIPSGWSVDEDPDAQSTNADEDDDDDVFTPDVVISLTAPKTGLKKFKGVSYLGGRFLPESIVQKYGLETLVDGYVGDEQVVDITGWTPAPEQSKKE